jgi:hypothetical protein
MLAQKFKSDDVEAFPVYGDRAHYENSKLDLTPVEEALTVAITQHLPVPAQDTPLENLVRLRNDAAFQAARTKMLEWKRRGVQEILLAPDREQKIADQMKEFDALTKAYSKEMHAAGHHKMTVAVSIFISAVTAEWVGVFKEGAVSFSELREPSWKKVTQMDCAPGGVVYHFQEALL